MAQVIETPHRRRQWPLFLLIQWNCFGCSGNSWRVYGNMYYSGDIIDTVGPLGDYWYACFISCHYNHHTLDVKIIVVSRMKYKPWIWPPSRIGQYLWTSAPSALSILLCFLQVRLTIQHWVQEQKCKFLSMRVLMHFIILFMSEWTMKVANGTNDISNTMNLNFYARSRGAINNLRGEATHQVLRIYKINIILELTMVIGGSDTMSDTMSANIVCAFMCCTLM